LADYEDIPNLIHEIARLREETFRAIGEGTGKNLDQDEFDSHFKHLILWDKAKQKIVGCYRLGIGSEIVPKYGIKGFYVSTLVNFSESFIPYLEHTIELGRSFVALDYQKEVLPLVLLLRGLSDVVVRYPNIEHFIGPVSISSWYPKFYQSMIVKYVTEKHPVSEDLAHMATPLTPFHSDFLKANPDVLMQGNMESIDKFDKFMFRLSNGQYRLPTLFKKYLKLNAKFLCFNVDPDFNDTLDALLFLTFTDFPEDEVMPLFRDSSDEEKEIVRKRFGYI
jgi:predicted GNAT family N-acyltransferase